MFLSTERHCLYQAYADYSITGVHIVRTLLSVWSPPLLFNLFFPCHALPWGNPHLSVKRPELSMLQGTCPASHNLWPLPVAYKEGRLCSESPL